MFFSTKYIKQKEEAKIQWKNEIKSVFDFFENSSKNTFFQKKKLKSFYSKNIWRNNETFLAMDSFFKILHEKLNSSQPLAILMKKVKLNYW